MTGSPSAPFHRVTREDATFHSAVLTIATSTAIPSQCGCVHNTKSPALTSRPIPALPATAGRASLPCHEHNEQL